MDRDAKLTTANLRAAGFLDRDGDGKERYFLGIECGARWFLQVIPEKPDRAFFFECRQHGAQHSSVFALPPISTIGELVDWYERLSGKKWMERKESK